MLGTVQLRNGNFAQTEPSNTWAPTAINNRADRSLIWQSDAGRWQQVTITAWRWLCCKLHVPEPMWNVQYLAPFHPFNSKRDWILRQRWRHHQVQRPTIPPKENTANLKKGFFKADWSWSPLHAPPSSCWSHLSCQQKYACQRQIRAAFFRREIDRSINTALHVKYTLSMVVGLRSWPQTPARVWRQRRQKRAAQQNRHTSHNNWS